MSITDKVQQIKQLVTLVCDVVPSIVSIIKEIIVVLRELKTA